MSETETPTRADLDHLAVIRHRLHRGKIQVLPRVPVDRPADLDVWYTPGVAAVSRAVAERPDAVDELTNRANTVAIVSDGTRVLGLGSIGPRAGLPVMEGKALLFKMLGGVDAVPLCLDTTDADELVRAVELLQPSFGGINLEDIEQPKCFDVLDQLRHRLAIPVWHDDQQGTATVVVAGLTNALEVVGKQLADVRIAMIGTGAAGVACYRLLRAAGLDPAQVVACDSTGVLHRGRRDIRKQRARFRDKWRICEESNPERVTGSIVDALRGADVCVAFSQPGPDVIEPAWIREMASDAIVFACANPTPEIWPDAAHAAGATVVATGRGDLPNQVNNSLGFPGIFRGVIDSGARAITDEMALAAAGALAHRARELGLAPDRILPAMLDTEAHARVAAAAGTAAVELGLARHHLDHAWLLAEARDRIEDARRSLDALVAAGVIAHERA